MWFKTSPVSTRAAILSALVRGEASGYEIKKRVVALTGGRLKIGQSSLYPALRGLEADGLIVGRDEVVAVAKKGRPRALFKLTPEGVEAFNEFQQAASQLTSLPDGFVIETAPSSTGKGKIK